MCTIYELKCSPTAAKKVNSDLCISQRPRKIRTQGAQSGRVHASPPLGSKLTPLVGFTMNFRFHLTPNAISQPKKKKHFGKFLKYKSVELRDFYQKSFYIMSCPKCLPPKHGSFGTKPRSKEGIEEVCTYWDLFLLTFILY